VSETNTCFFYIYDLNRDGVLTFADIDLLEKNEEL